MFRYWWTLVSTCPRPITWVAGVAVMALVLKIFVLNTIAAPFESWYSFGLLVEAVLASVVAAYVFFLLSVHAPKVMERQHVAASIVARLARTASYNMTGFLQLLEHDLSPVGSKVQLLDRHTVDLNKVNELFQTAKPNNLVSMIAGWNSSSRLTVMQAMARHDEWCYEAIEKIWRFINYLEPDAIRFLYDIQESLHAKRMRDYREKMYVTGISNPDISVYAEEYFNYYRMAVELDNYFEAVARRYAANH